MLVMSCLNIVKVTSEIALNERYKTLILLVLETVVSIYTTKY